MSELADETTSRKAGPPAAASPLPAPNSPPINVSLGYANKPAEVSQPRGETEDQTFEWNVATSNDINYTCALTCRDMSTRLPQKKTAPDSFGAGDKKQYVMQPMQRCRAAAWWPLTAEALTLCGSRVPMLQSAEGFSPLFSCLYLALQ